MGAQRAAQRRAPRTTGRSPADPVGLLGGTFDPIHYGHLRFAAEVKTALGLGEMRLIPAGNPGHRGGPRASAADRLAMARLAVEEFPELVVDDREVRRRSPSYTVVTLEELRREVGERPLVWLIGSDAFCDLPTWHRWQRLFDLAHFLVTPRPGYALDAAVPAALRPDWDARRTTDARKLSAAPAGAILELPVTPQPISASALRRRLEAGEDVSGLLPASVLHYIRSHHLYLSTGCV